VILPLKPSVPFSLDLSLNSGQAFSWSKREGVWWGAIRNVAFALKQRPEGLEYWASTPNVKPILVNYLALDEDPADILRHFPTDPFLSRCVQANRGLRILRQDPWECLAGFILSSCKQITHIQAIWKKVSENWGKPLTVKAHHATIYSFPESAVIARLEESQLRKCGMGFRAPYLLNAAKHVSTGALHLENLRSLPTVDARAQLTALNGVGRKIADCVLLFSLDKMDAFPIDTWISKVIRKIYLPKKRKMNAKQIQQFADTYFGKYGGYAQQYLFHYARMNGLNDAILD
jgi:N-glycosylase/DNA lyase